MTRPTTILYTHPVTNHTERISAPWFTVGDRVRVKDGAIGNPEAAVVEVAGPYLYYGSDRSDPWLYYVDEPARNERYPCKGSSLERINGERTKR